MDSDSTYEESEDDFLSNSSESDALSTTNDSGSTSDLDTASGEKSMPDTIYRTIIVNPRTGRNSVFEDEIIQDKPRMKMILDRYVNVNRVPASEYYQSRRRDNIPRPADAFRVKRN